MSPPPDTTAPPALPPPETNPLAQFTAPSPTRDETTRRVGRLVGQLDSHIRHGEPSTPGTPAPLRTALEAVDDLNGVMDALRPRLPELHALGLPTQPTAARWSSSLVSRLRGHHIQLCREARSEGDTAQACLRLTALALDIVRRRHGLPAGAASTADLSTLVDDTRQLLQEMDAARTLTAASEPDPEPDPDERTALLDRTLQTLGLPGAPTEAGALAAACLEQAIVGPAPTEDTQARSLEQTSSWAIASAIHILGTAEAHVRVRDPVLPLQKRRPVAQRIRREVDVLTRHFQES